MSRMYSARILASAVMIGIALGVGPMASAATIGPGFDFFSTQTGTSVTLPAPTGMISLISFPYGPTASGGPNAPGFDGQPGSLFPVPTDVALQAGLLSINWFDEHGNQVAAASIHAVGASVTPITPPGLPGNFDTIVQRPSGVSITGMGATAIDPIQIRWLSLRSDPAHPVNFFGNGVLYDVYVGLAPGPQILGKMLLASTSSDGTQGTASIGLKGVTTDDPTAPGFLGLPVPFVVDLIPAGESPIPANVFTTITNIPPAIFHGNDVDPSGTYLVTPEPPSVLLASIGAMVLFGIMIGRRRLNSVA